MPDRRSARKERKRIRRRDGTRRPQTSNDDVPKHEVTAQLELDCQCDDCIECDAHIVRGRADERIVRYWSRPCANGLAVLESVVGPGLRVGPGGRGARFLLSDCERCFGQIGAARISFREAIGLPCVSCAAEVGVWVEKGLGGVVRATL